MTIKNAKNCKTQEQLLFNTMEGAEIMAPKYGTQYSMEVLLFDKSNFISFFEKKSNHLSPMVIANIWKQGVQIEVS